MAYCCRNDLANATRQLKEEIDNLFTSYLRSTRDLVTKVHYCIVNTYVLSFTDELHSHSGALFG